MEASQFPRPTDDAVGPETDDLSALPTPVIEDDADASVLDELKQLRTELEPIGKTVVLEVPGYKGKLAVEYNYIGTEITEQISRRVRKETKRVGYKGAALLSSCDLLDHCCKRVLIRSLVESNEETNEYGLKDNWRPLNPAPVVFDSTLSGLLKFHGAEPREVILGLFGSEHAVIDQNMRLSAWLTDTSEEVNEDFFG